MYTKNSNSVGLGSNGDLFSETPATNGLCHGTVDCYSILC